MYTVKALDQLRSDWREIDRIIGRSLGDHLLVIMQDAIRYTQLEEEGTQDELEDMILEYINHAVIEEGVA